MVTSLEFKNFDDEKRCKVIILNREIQVILKRERGGGRQTDRQTEIETDRQTD